MGSYHPVYKDLYYPVNYGYVAHITGGDGEPQDAYILGVDTPVETFTGCLIAVVHREDDNEEKWVVAPEGFTCTPEEIMEKISFQERFFESTVRML